MSNFQLRTLTTVIGGAAMIAILIAGNELLLVTLLTLSFIGYHELTSALGVDEPEKKFTPMLIPGYICILAWYVLLELGDLEVIQGMSIPGYGAALIVLMLIVYMAVYVFTYPAYDATRAISAFFSTVYLPVMLSFVYLIRQLEGGALFVWMVPICSWVCDICAYLVGVKFGKHKMSPKLSPKKSIEGAIGGVAGSAIIGALYAFFAVSKNVSADRWKVVLIFVIMSVCGAFISMIGDLAASAIKRNRGIKDYGKIIPGHGGVMDRFDSFIFVAPLVYILCLFIV